MIGLLLRHVLLLVVVGFVLVGVIYRDAIFGLQPATQETPAAELPMPSTSHPDEGPSEPATAPPVIAPPARQPSDKTPAQDESLLPEATPPEPPSVAEKPTQAGTDDRPSSAETMSPSADSPRDTVSGAGDVVSDTAPSQDTKRAETGDHGGDAAPTEYRFRPMQLPAEDDPKQTIDQARRAYWSGDIRAAIALYQSSRLREAAAEFQAAAGLLIERREVVGAGRMIEALAAVDPVHARQLQRQLENMGPQ